MPPVPASGPASSQSLGGFNSETVIVLICSALAVYKGLYFWSLLIATSGIIPYVVGLCIFYFEWTYKLVGYIINNYGWAAMVTGQSVVLYSRLGIVLGKGHDGILKFVKWMIIVDGFVFYVTTTVVVFGGHYAPNPVPFNAAYKYVEKIQMTGFTIQELIISGLYVWKTLDILNTASDHHKKRRISLQLFIINVVIIFLDVGLLALEYRNLFVQEVAFKELAYSIKLKLEFAILSKLVETSNNGQRRMSNYFGDTTGFLDSSGRSQSFVPISPTLTSTSVSRPQWIHDVEKANVKPDGVDNQGNALQQGHSEISYHHKAQCGGLQPTKHESDLMYAEAMRVLSK